MLAWIFPLRFFSSLFPPTRVDCQMFALSFVSSFFPAGPGTFTHSTVSNIPCRRLLVLFWSPPPFVVKEPELPLGFPPVPPPSLLANGEGNPKGYPTYSSCDFQVRFSSLRVPFFRLSIGLAILDQIDLLLPVEVLEGTGTSSDFPFFLSLLVSRIHLAAICFSSITFSKAGDSQLHNLF